MESEGTLEPEVRTLEPKSEEPTHRFGIRDAFSQQVSSERCGLDAFQANDCRAMISVRSIFLEHVAKVEAQREVVSLFSERLRQQSVV